MTSVALDTIAIEQLAWGKFAVREDGAVDGRQEHDVLGKSARFPAALIAYCQPGRLGVAKHQSEVASEQLFAQVWHGTGLQSVLIAGVPCTVLYRAGMRGEGGDRVARSRRYTLAHYLADPSRRASPLALFGVMRPLTALSVRDARALRAMAIPASGERTASARVIARATMSTAMSASAATVLGPIGAAGPLDATTRTGAVGASGVVGEPPPLDERLIEGALERIMSGVPVHIALPETPFFWHVDAIWRLLPPELRPLLGAGWNVSSTVGAERAISCCQRVPPTCADYVDGAWREPTAASAAHATAVLAPGRFFLTRRLAPTAAASRMDELVHGIAQAPRLPRSATGQGDPALPSFADAAVIQRIRATALALAGHAVVRRLESWIAEGTESLEDVAGALVAHLTLAPDLARLARAIRDGWSHPDRRSRADVAAWHLFDVAGASSSLTTPDDAWAARASLIGAAREGAAEAILAALRDAGRARQADDVAPLIAARVEAALEAPRRASAWHLELLPHAAHLPVYRDWLWRRAFDLALACAGRGEPDDERCVAALRAWCETLLPDASPVGPESASPQSASPQSASPQSTSTESTSPRSVDTVSVGAESVGGVSASTAWGSPVSADTLSADVVSNRIVSDGAVAAGAVAAAETVPTGRAIGGIPIGSVVIGSVSIGRVSTGVPGGVIAVASLVAGRAPDAADHAAIEALTTADAERFAALLGTRWTIAVSADERQALPEWASLPNVPAALLGPVLRAARGDGLTASELAALVREHDLRLLPPRAALPLSRLAFDAVESLREQLLDRPEAWAPILRPWPEAMRLLIAGPASTMAEAATLPASTAASAMDAVAWPAFQPSTPLLQDLVDEWTQLADAARVDLLPRVAPQLWAWCAASRPLAEAELHAVDLCRGLAQGRLPSRRGDVASRDSDREAARDARHPMRDTRDPGRDPVRDAARDLTRDPSRDPARDPAPVAQMLARLCGDYAALHASATGLWHAAEEPWQLRLLLELFPSAALTPSLAQLERLMPRRRWLRGHLTRRDLHRDRVASFEIAQFDFAELSPDEPRNLARYDVWRRSAFHGAFQRAFERTRLAKDDGGEAEDRERARAQAIQAYGGSPRGIVRACLLALDDAGDGYAPLVTEIGSRFLLPWARQAGLTGDELSRTLHALAQPDKTKTRLTLDAREHAAPFRRADGMVVVADFLLPLAWRLFTADRFRELDALVERTSDRRSLS